MGEVDQFLDEVEAELRRLDTENAELRDRLDGSLDLDARIVQPGVRPDR